MDGETASRRIQPVAIASRKAAARGGRKAMLMSCACDHLADWRDNECAFQAAMTEVNALVCAAGYVLRQPHNEMKGWPYVLHAEVRPPSSLRLLASLDVGLNDHGEMLVQTIPGEARTFHSFQAKDKAYYVRSFRRLVGSALVSHP